jgi:hypothetical protein
MLIQFPITIFRLILLPEMCAQVLYMCRTEAELLAPSSMPRYSILIESTSSGLLPQGVEGSRPTERSELIERDVFIRTDSVS